MQNQIRSASCGLAKKRRGAGGGKKLTKVGSTHRSALGEGGLEGEINSDPHRAERGSLMQERIRARETKINAW